LPEEVYSWRSSFVPVVRHTRKVRADSLTLGIALAKTDKNSKIQR